MNYPDLERSMHIPTYWSEYSLEFQYLNKTTKVKRFGWSDHSVADAQQCAIRRCEQARDEILAGRKKIKRIEAKNAEYALPIREQVLQHYPDVNAVLSINRYGAHCLNVENVLILDVDHAELKNEIEQAYPLIKHLEQVKQIKFMWAIAFGFLAGLLALYLNYQPFLWVVGVWLISGLIIHFINRSFITQAHQQYHNQIQTHLQEKQGYLGIIIEKVQAFCDHHPDLLFYLYQTPQGFRLIAVNENYLVKHKIVQACFQQLPIDPIYQKLCQQQQGFRARVTAKPWRMQQHKMNTIPYIYFWKTDMESQLALSQRQKWLTDYHQASQHYSACHFIQTIGQGKISPKIVPFIQLHDQLCQAQHKLPLA